MIKDSQYETAPLAPRTVKGREQYGEIKESVRSFGIAVTRGLALFGRFIAQHPNPMGYAFLLLVSLMLPFIGIFVLGSILCYLYWLSGRP